VSSISGNGKTEIIYGTSNVLDREIQFFSNAEHKVNTCMEHTRPLFASKIEPIRKSFLGAKSRNVRLRYITEITPESITDCKELMKIADVRHLCGIKGNFMVSEKEYLAPAISHNTSIASQIIYSNLQEIVEQQNYIFDTLWNKAIPAIKRIREIEDKQISGITEVLYGSENAVGRGVQFMKNVKKRMDICFDSKAPSIVVEIDAYRNGYKDIRNRGGKIRAFTEITRDNIHYCKELIRTQLVDELRHLEGMKGGIAVSESEYMATTVLQEATPLTQVIYSNTREVVEQMQYIFDIFWYRAIPADQKIREIEEGIVHVETKVLENSDEIFNHMRCVIENASKRLLCSTSGGMQMAYNNFFDLYKKIISSERGGVRCITTIDKENKDLVNIFLNAGAQVRHVKNLPPVNFAVDEKYLHATIEKMEDGKMMQSLLTSNEPIYINHYNSIFEELWKDGIDASQRIRDIEEGVDQADLEIIHNPNETIKRSWDLVRSANREVSIIVSTPNAFRRQVRMGVLQLFMEATEKNHDLKIRILIPSDRLISMDLNNAKKACPRVDFRAYEEHYEKRITIILADTNGCLIMESKDDLKDSSYESIGLSTYSNSNSICLSYNSIFESLWKQTELYEQLRVHDTMQKEFINIAAHELRTPIQPILGLTELLRNQIKDVKQRELLDIAIRNAKRLQRLTEDILDVTRIETKSLVLNKESFDLSDMIINTILDFNNQITKENKDNDLTLELTSRAPQEPILIDADKGRINQVLSNLLSNAIKFTNKGSIYVAVHKSRIEEEVLVSIKDTGSGIDPEIMPRLFTKFATNSIGGTGLGLFISKNIIESHDGRIWAENNTNGKGTTFSFSLPVGLRTRP
jgi:nitrogen-specific signal transduction histidine kinase